MESQHALQVRSEPAGVSLIVPARNEGARLRPLLAAVEKVATYLHEVVLVLDGCTDDSREIVSDVLVHWPATTPFRLVERPLSQGKAEAVLAGLRVATGQYACLWDADLEYDLSALPAIVAFAYPGVLVSGCRESGRGWKSLAANAVTRSVLKRWGTPPFDVLTGVHLAERAWMRGVLEHGFVTGYALEAVLVRHALRDGLSCPCAEVPYHARSIAEGRGVRLRHLWGILRAAHGSRRDSKAPKAQDRAALIGLLVGTALALALVLGLPAAHAAAAGSSLPTSGKKGKIFNPLTDTNWKDMFPIVIGGVNATGASQPPTVNEPAVCLCPSHFFGFPVPGVGLSFWQPSYVVEVTRHPGRLLTLGGADVLGKAFKFEASPQRGNSANSENEGENHQQVHWYAYPLFKIIGLGISSLCTSMQGTFDLAAITEVDPTWQNDLWAIVLSPDAALFAGPIAQLACVADAASAAVWYPLDPLFWCAGSWGSAYPFSSNANTASSDTQTNALELAKFLARESRFGLVLATITPAAMCSSFWSPVWIKTQWRVDPIYPHPIHGHPIYIGQTPIRWGFIPPANYPTEQDSAYLLWQARQCCIRT